MATLEEEVQQRVNNEGVNYTSRTWQLLKAKGKTLTKEESDAYVIIQKAHVEFTGHSLPPLPGARKTRTQVKAESAPIVSDAVIEEAVKGGLAARLASMRKDK